MRIRAKTAYRGPAATLLAAVLLCVGVPAAGAAPIFGFNDSAESFEAHAGQASSAGATIARLPVSWELTQPAPGPFDWSEIDPAVQALKAQGIRVLFVISATPAWAAGDCEPDDEIVTCGVGEGHEDDYQRLVIALLQRYPGSKVQAWNEPNIGLFGALTPKRAAELTNDLYEVAPHKVVGPAASPGDAAHLPYTRHMYRHINPHVPLAVNFYPRSVVSVRGLQDDWPDVREIAGPRPVWVTEIGFSSSEYGTDGQASRAAAAYDFLTRKGAHAIIFHRLLDVPVAGSPWLSSLGMLTADGIRKPAYKALRRAVIDATR